MSGWFPADLHIRHAAEMARIQAVREARDTRAAETADTGVNTRMK